MLRVIALKVVLVTRLEGLVTLLASRAMFQVEPLSGLEQLIPLLAQPSDYHGIQAHPLL